MFIGLAALGNKTVLTLKNNQLYSIIVYSCLASFPGPTCTQLFVACSTEKRESKPGNNANSCQSYVMTTIQDKAPANQKTPLAMHIASYLQEPDTSSYAENCVCRRRMKGVCKQHLLVNQDRHAAPTQQLPILVWKEVWSTSPQAKSTKKTMLMKYLQQ